MHIDVAEILQNPYDIYENPKKIRIFGPLRRPLDSKTPSLVSFYWTNSHNNPQKIFDRYFFLFQSFTDSLPTPISRYFQFIILFSKSIFRNIKLELEIPVLPEISPIVENTFTSSEHKRNKYYCSSHSLYRTFIGPSIENKGSYENLSHFPISCRNVGLKVYRY